MLLTCDVELAALHYSPQFFQNSVFDEGDSAAFFAFGDVAGDDQHFLCHVLGMRVGCGLWVVKVVALLNSGGDH